MRRFWNKVAVGGKNQCWPWLASGNRKGYGLFWYEGRAQPASRVAYELVKQVKPGALYVLHECDNPKCCNPMHLFLGTASDNMQDKIAKGRHAEGVRGSLAKLTLEQVREIRASSAVGTILAARYGVSKGTISKIRLRKTYRKDF